MTRYALHIGTHKTGSTFIQKFLVQHRNKLREEGVDFPIVGGLNVVKVHQPIANYFRLIEDEYGHFVDEQLCAGLSDTENVIVSAEGLYHCSNPNALSRVFAAFGAELHVICYLRDPISHAISMHQQTVKSKGATITLQEFINRHIKQMDAGNGYYNYDNNLNLWRGRFPDTIVAAYRRGNNKIMLARFFDLCGMPIDITGMKIPKNPNASLSNEFTLLIRRINRICHAGGITDTERKDWMRFITVNTEACKEIASTAIEMTKVDVSEFVKTFDRLNQNARNLIGQYEGPLAFEVPSALSLSDNEMLGRLQEIQSAKTAWYFRWRYSTVGRREIGTDGCLN